MWLQNESLVMTVLHKQLVSCKYIVLSISSLTYSSNKYLLSLCSTVDLVLGTSNINVDKTET